MTSRRLSAIVTLEPGYSSLSCKDFQFDVRFDAIIKKKELTLDGIARPYPESRFVKQSGIMVVLVSLSFLGNYFLNSGGHEQANNTSELSILSIFGLSVTIHKFPDL